jgi:hypothetical protein
VRDRRGIEPWRSFWPLGYCGLISEVAVNNCGSLHALRRMGFIDFGSPIVLKIGNHSFVHTSQSCRAYGYSYQAPAKWPTQPHVGLLK